MNKQPSRKGYGIPLLGGIAAMLVTLTVTSYIVWRRDPARTMETDA